MKIDHIPISEKDIKGVVSTYSSLPFCNNCKRALSVCDCCLLSIEPNYGIRCNPKTKKHYCVKCIRKAGVR